MLRRLFTVGTMIFIPFVFANCAAPKAAPQAVVVVEDKDEPRLDKALTSAIEKKYRKWNDGAGIEVLSRVATKIWSEGFAGEGSSEVHGLFTESALSAPGFRNSVYLSVGTLQLCQYENEAAFIIAQQLALVSKKALVNRYSNLEAEDIARNTIAALPTMPIVDPSTRGKGVLAGGWFDKGGLFAFSEQDYLEADVSAIQALVKAGYDARGAVTYLQALAKLKGKDLGSQITPDIQDRIARARNEVAHISPQKDAIVKTSSFEKLRNRLKTAKTVRNAGAKIDANKGRDS